MKKFLIILPLFLSACGFTPMHQKNSSTISPLKSVSISPISGTRGIDLRQQLSETLTPNGSSLSPVYRLDITLHQPRVDLRGLRQDGTATWGTVIAKADIKLVERSSEKILLQAQETAFSSYQVLSSVYSSMTTSEDSYDLATETLGRQIIARVQSTLFRKKKTVEKNQVETK